MGHDFQTLVDSDDIKIKLQKKKENKTKNTRVGVFFVFAPLDIKNSHFARVYLWKYLNI